MASDLDVGRLRVLREVAVRGSIAAAGRSLGLTASAVSQQLSTLERETGTSLVDRSHRGVELTTAGRLLAGRADEVLAVLSQARADLEQLTGQVGGRVRIAAVASAAATFVSRAISGLALTHPGVDASVLSAEPAHALELLAADDVDLAVVDEYDLVPLPVSDRLVSTPLRDERLVLVGAPGRLPGGLSAVGLAQLADRDWIMPPDTAACGLAVRLACRAAGFEPRVRWETDDMWLLTRAAADGHGVAVLAPLAVVGAGDRPAAVEVRPLREPELHRRLTALARPSGQARPAVTTVIEAVRAAAADGA